MVSIGDEIFTFQSVDIPLAFFHCLDFIKNFHTQNHSVVLLLGVMITHLGFGMVAFLDLVKTDWARSRGWKRLHFASAPRERGCGTLVTF